MNKIGGRSNTEFSKVDLRYRTWNPIRNNKIEKRKTYNQWSWEQKTNILDEVRLSSGN